MQHRITLDWAGGTDEFGFDLGFILSAQDEADLGPQEMLAKLRNGGWRVQLPMAILRCGLIRGGMDRAAAQRKVEDTVNMRGLMALLPAAITLLVHALSGPADDPVGGEAPGEDQGVRQPAPMENGLQADSTDPAP